MLFFSNVNKYNLNGKNICKRNLGNTLQCWICCYKLKGNVSSLQRICHLLTLVSRQTYFLHQNTQEDM